jgi:hypothetical protein
MDAYGPGLIVDMTDADSWALILSEVVALVPVIAAAVVAIIVAWRRLPPG